ncbi:hypothetical protein MB02_11860 [Croceicoccus estronivorus]|uniref:hypothetical protein n=1 Tax=Croceicoccus estronivorus TaxID=1172626 RepID=UPI000832064D|nr:hypothetical protein [Croceicoccus estronivorus]OCC23323.1 hypothetical protein MB02_11860 [Croceicoccus estronivorus]
MISRFDDYCLHQTPDYLRVPATTDRNFYDRYFFSGYERSGAIVFGAAFGRYPNRHVQDAHFSVAVGGRQVSLHASLLLSPDPSIMECGPLKLEIVEPMRLLRCYGDAEGVGYDLEFRAETGAIDEGRLKLERDGMTFIDQTRFMQYGRWHGWIAIDGVRYPVDQSRCHGLRDKSWGVRLFAENHTTAEKGGQIFWMNLVARLDGEFCVIRVLDDGEGVSKERTGYFAPVYDTPVDVPVGEPCLIHVADWTFDLDFRDGTRRIGGGRYRVELEDGSCRDWEMVAGPSFYYAGIGYNHATWNHGLSHGPVLALEREDWDLSGVDMSRLDRQMLLSVMTLRENGRVIGFGHTEQLLMGPYRPLGWSEAQYVDL